MSDLISKGRLLDAMRNDYQALSNDDHRALRSAYRILMRKIENAPTVDTTPKWISVEERLPENDDDVLMMTNYGIGMGYYSANIDKTWYDYTCTDMAWVSHWMPLPEPPKEDAL